MIRLNVPVEYAVNAALSQVGLHPQGTVVILSINVKVQLQELYIYVISVLLSLHLIFLKYLK